jgi:hypothetical protein
MTRWWQQLRGEGPATPETWRSFYAQMRELAALPAEERKLRLCAQWGEAAKQRLSANKYFKLT